MQWNRNGLLVFAAVLVAASISVRGRAAGYTGARYPEVRIEQDISYLGAGREEKADLYAPVTDQTNVRFPGVVIIHGGGWTGGDKARSREINIGTELAKAGYVCLSINYRLGANAWPGNLEDCKNAVRFLRQQADVYHVDPDFIGAIGGSAGGHLVSMLGVTGPDAGLDPAGPLSGYSCRVQAVVDLYGVTNFLTRVKTLGDGTPTEELVDGSMASVLGKDRDVAPDLWRLASPVTHITRDDPPVLILHGKADTTVDWKQSTEFAAALDAAGVPNTLQLIDGIGHTFDLQAWRNKPLPEDLRPVAVGFFDRHLKYPSTRVPLWPEGVPGGEGAPDHESFASKSKTQVDRWYLNVIHPDLRVFLPAPDKATGAAVVICPGGGYGGLAYDYEGIEVAQWLNTLGVAGFVLKYRMPRPEGFVFGYTAPLADAQRALRIVRARAGEWGVNPERVGILGFSAGGHLAASAATHYKPGIADEDDSLREYSCRPDFAVLVYPVISMGNELTHDGSRKNLLGDNPSAELVEKFSNELQVTRDTPPCFLVHAADDWVRPANSLAFANALVTAKVPVEMHLYPAGGHGFGLGRNGGVPATWPARCATWMEGLGLLAR